mmetsp:Transcript_50150/g.127664  ORF Transcript_50150/g.127664 Transcript_50150/m.127664 type:complete len:252 (-) Transcript_50150:297-1052(-)
MSAILLIFFTIEGATREGASFSCWPPCNCGPPPFCCMAFWTLAPASLAVSITLVYHSTILSSCWVITCNARSGSLFGGGAEEEDAGLVPMAGAAAAVASCCRGACNACSGSLFGGAEEDAGLVPMAGAATAVASCCWGTSRGSAASLGATTAVLGDTTPWRPKLSLSCAQSGGPDMPSTNPTAKDAATAPNCSSKPGPPSCWDGGVVADGVTTSGPAGGAVGKAAGEVVGGEGVESGGSMATCASGRSSGT